MVCTRPDPRSKSPAIQSWKAGHFQKLSTPLFTIGAGNWPRILKLGHNIHISSCRIFYIWPSFCVTWLDCQSLTGLIFLLTALNNRLTGVKTGSVDVGDVSLDTNAVTDKKVGETIRMFCCNMRVV